MSKRTKIIIGIIVAAGVCVCGGIYSFSLHENSQATNLVNKVDTTITNNFNDTTFSKPTKEGINEEVYNNLENQINTMQIDLGSASNKMLLYPSTKELISNNEELLSSFNDITNLLYDLNSIHTAITNGSFDATNEAISNIKASSSYESLNNIATSNSLQEEVGSNNAKVIVEQNTFIRDYVNKVESIINNNALIESSLPNTSLSELINK